MHEDQNVCYSSSNILNFDVIKHYTTE